MVVSFIPIFMMILIMCIKFGIHCSILDCHLGSNKGASSCVCHFLVLEFVIETTRSHQSSLETLMMSSARWRYGLAARVPQLCSKRATRNRPLTRVVSDEKAGISDYSTRASICSRQDCLTEWERLLEYIEVLGRRGSPCCTTTRL